MTDQISNKQIDAILQFLDVFEADDFVSGQWHSEKGSMPWFEQSEEVGRFVQALYDNGWIVSFDWTAWQKEAARYVESPELLISADLETIQKLLTTHVRKERFCEGHLAGMFRSGHVVAMLRRLREIRQERE